MAHIDEYYDDQFEQFLDELCHHIRIVGGFGNPVTFKNMTLEEAYKHLRPNGIVLGFRNLRMKKKYQLSYQMKAEVLYEDREDETD